MGMPVGIGTLIRRDFHGPAQTPNGAMEAHTKPIRRNPKRDRGLSRSEPLPSNQGDRLTVVCVQPRQGESCEITLAVQIDARHALGCDRARGALDESEASGLRSPLGPERIASYAQQPWERFIGHGRPPPPSDEEDISYDVINLTLIGSAVHVCVHRRMMGAKQLFEPLALA